MHSGVSEDERTGIEQEKKEEREWHEEQVEREKQEEQEKLDEQKETTKGKAPPSGGIPKLSEETWQAVQILLLHGVGTMKTKVSKLLNP